MVDNLDLIKEYLTANNRWPEPDKEFFFLQIIQRRKENPEQESNNRTIKSYYIRGERDLDKKYDEIQKICGLFRARACIALNRLNYSKVALRALELTAKQIANEQPWSTAQAFDSAAGKVSTEKEKLWILDIDDTDPMVLSEVAFEATELVKETGRTPNFLTLPTKNGFHLLCQPFNRSKFTKKIDIHPQNPTVLYIP